MSKIKSPRNGTKKETIARKAATLFRKKGFKATSMRELADMIGVEAPSLYNHIGSKDEILSEICLKTAYEYNDHMNLIDQSEELAIEKLREIIRFHIRMMIEKYDEVFVVNHEWKQLIEPQLSEFTSLRKSYESRFLNVITKGIADKEFRNIHPYVAMLTILSSVRGLEIWYRHKNHLSAEELEQNMTTYLLNGIKK